MYVHVQETMERNANKEFRVGHTIYHKWKFEYFKNKSSTLTFQFF